MSTPPEYYFEDGTYVKFDKYTIDTNGVIMNKKTGKILNTLKKGRYNECSLYDNYGKSYGIRVCRAIVSTFQGRPPTLEHTADHDDRNKNNDTNENLSWLSKSEQSKNREIPSTYKSSVIIVKDNIEKTITEWVGFLRNEKNNKGREYTDSMIYHYAKHTKHGFAYKEYPDLPGEVWKEIIGSKTKMGSWKISNLCRVKYITKHMERILTEANFTLQNGYPVISFKNKQWYCHVLVFMTFFPDEWASKKPEEIILHENDDKMDFRPHKLRLGTQSENIADSYASGCRVGTKTERMRCASYVNDVIEREYISQSDAVIYLRSNGHSKATCGEISQALKAFRENRIITRYGRTWRCI